MLRSILAGLLLAILVSPVAAAAEPGVVKKSSVDVYAEPRLDARKVSTLKRDARVTVSAQQGLWYQLQLPGGQTGYVRINDIRLAQAAGADGGAVQSGLTGGQAGAGRATETAGVRGIDDSELKTAAYNQAELDSMTGYRVADADASSHAAAQSWEATRVAYDNELKPRKSEPPKSASGGGGALNAARGLLGSFGGGSVSSDLSKVDTATGTAQRLKPKSEEQQAAEELALGPQITGRALGARPLWNDAAAQQRVNTIGRWMASQTSRPELPWSFGIIDTSEVGAFAAPGGYVLVTRGLYELLSSDAEIAAVLAHEIAHCVQRDHYNVIRNQELASTGKDLGMAEIRAEAASSEVAQTQTGNAALNFALQYVEKHGATILLTSLDRAAEYQADQAAEIYLARAGMNPLAFYAVLQKMASLGKQSPKLAALYRTHPALDDRMDRIDRRGYQALKAYTGRE